MKFDLSEFLDSLKGLIRSVASRLIEDKMNELNKFNQRPKPSRGRTAIEHRTYMREAEFLTNLLYEVKVGGRSELNKFDREEVDEVLKNLKLDAPLKIIKKTDR